jgi:hypothetical protein
MIQSTAWRGRARPWRGGAALRCAVIVRTRVALRAERADDVGVIRRDVMRMWLVLACGTGAAFVRADVAAGQTQASGATNPTSPTNAANTTNAAGGGAGASASDRARDAAEVTQTPVGAEPGTPVEQGVGDVGVLSTSLRQAPADLRVASDFERVYRGDDGMLFRQDGALVASFPESEYVQTRRGTQTVIPAGTVFSIGPPMRALWEARRARSGAPMVRPGEIVATPLGQAMAVPAGQPMGIVATQPAAVLASDGAPVAPQAVAGGDQGDAQPAADRRFDVSDEYYRKQRLKQIASRHKNDQRREER